MSLRTRTRRGSPRIGRAGIAVAVLTALILVVIAPTGALAKKPPNVYTVHPLVSDLASLAPTVDPNLVNGWGLVAGAATPWWVSDNGADKSTLYDGAGVPRSLVVTVASAPDGIVFNGTTGFPVSPGNPSRFLFATENGTILGWNLAVSGVDASMVVDRSGVGAVYKGLALGFVGTTPYLYATDFVNGRVDVFAGDFTLQNWTGAFKDPKLPKGYAPFGIQAIGDSIFVTYGKQQLPDTDEAHGPGLGVVDEFSTTGALISRVATHGKLNAPWGLAMSPSDFAEFSDCLLVGNFGDGHINAFQADKHHHWKQRGALAMKNHKPVTIDGLWGIAFGFGATTPSGPSNNLYFAAGPNGESDGLFGFVSAP